MSRKEQKKEMKKGDLVKCNHWMNGGKKGIVVSVQDGDYCIGAWILLECGSLKLIRIENLELINET